ncbi:MAG: hydrogenase maturation protease [bacterium]|nr:hydrogenase maturation protease [bacterium]MBU1918894.1 hydrogenase maturation protease [bacterium]
MMTLKKNKTLIVGVGNDILSDDGIGIKLVWDLESCFAKASQDRETMQPIDFKTAALGGLELLELIQGYEHVIFIDAIKTEGGVPGAVYEMTTDDFKETHHLSHVHDVSFLQALELGRRTGMKVASKINIIAIEIVEDLLFSDDFSPEVAAKWPEIKETVLQLVNKYLNQ